MNSKTSSIRAWWLAGLILGGALISVCLFGGQRPASARQDPPERCSLARVDLLGPIDALGLPVYAHLQDAAGRDYALVIAPPSQIERMSPSFRILDADTRGATYLVALERRPGARQQAARLMDVLHDDGRQIVVRVAPGRADTLAELGFDVQQLGDTPIIVRAPVLLPAPAAFAYDPSVAQMIAQVQQSTVYTYGGQLSGEWPALVGGVPYTINTRYTNSGVPIQMATQYVYEHMQGLGLATFYHNWSGCGISNRNVIGVLTGTTRPAEIVLVTAHLDDVPSSGRAPGADDNASGSVGVLVAADILSHYRFERTLRFVFFTGEEEGLCGSEQYAAMVHGAGENIVAVYNMDMIAWDSVDGPTLRLHTRVPSSPGYPGDLAIAGTFTNVVSAYDLSGSLTPILDPDGITASDHAPFWNQGYAAILATEDDVNDFSAYYHTPNDRLQFLNLPYFSNYVKASVGTVAHLAFTFEQSGYLKGILYDGTSGGGLPGVAVQASSSPVLSFTTTSGAGGLYSMLVPSATYTVTAAAPGYMRYITTGVMVRTDQTTTLNITLYVTPTFVITGYVRDALTHVPLSATVSVPGSPVTPTQTNPATGFYSLSLPMGNYVLQAAAMHYVSASRPVIVTGDQEQDFDLAPTCLLVVDGDGGMEYDTYCTSALDRLGLSYRRITQQPDLETLAHYQGVIWETGNQSANTLTAADQTSLASYLDGSGRLFLSGQDIGFDIGNTHFYRDYLHAAFDADNAQAWTLTGLNFLSGQDITIQGGDGGNNQLYPDEVTPVNGGIAVYQYPDPHRAGGVAYSGLYRSVYFSFGYEGINSSGRRDGVMSATLAYLEVCGAPHAPQAGFVTHSPLSWGETAWFTNTSRGTAWMTYTWAFGDGTPVSHVVNPMHKYTQAGSYVAVLTATSRYGESVYSDTVAVQPPGVLTVNLVGQGTVEQNPLPPYGYGDVVTLTATPAAGWSFSGWGGDLSGTDNPKAITLDSDKVVIATFTFQCVSISGLDFTFAPSAPKVGDSVIFTSTAAAGTAPLTCTWNFGDGGAGSGLVVAHLFPLTPTLQTFTVTLTAANACTSHATTSHPVTVSPRILYLPILLKH